MVHLHRRKVLSEPQGPPGGADLRFLNPQADTSLHCKTTDTVVVHPTVCLFTSQLSLVLIAPTHGGMARLSLPGWWLHTEMVYPPADGHPSKY